MTEKHAGGRPRMNFRTSEVVKILMSPVSTDGETMPAEEARELAVMIDDLGASGKFIDDHRKCKMLGPDASTEDILSTVYGTG